MTQNRFTKQVMDKATISKHHDYAYVIKTCEIMALFAEVQKELFPLPKGSIIQNNTTGARDKIVLELKDWLSFINKLRDWFGDKKEKTEK